MKKLAYIIVICLILSITGCTKDTEENDKTQSYMNAVINEISESEINVTPVDNEPVNSEKRIIKSESLIINSDIVAASGLPDIKSGDKIRIVYNNDSITEDPLKINIVFAVYLLDENNEVKPND